MGEKHNKLGIVSLVLGVLGLIFIFFPLMVRLFFLVPFELILSLLIFSLICSLSSTILGANLYFRRSKDSYNFKSLALGIIVLCLLVFILVWQILVRM